MRYLVCLLFLLLVLEVAVEARERKVRPDMCQYMFVNPRMAHKQCSAACWKNQNCWGYCDEEHGRKRCVCGDCERVCPPPTTEQPTTSPADIGQQSIIAFYANQIYVAAQDEFLKSEKYIKEELHQMMERYNIAYEAVLDARVKSVYGNDNVVLFVILSHVNCDLVRTVAKEFKDKVSLITSAKVLCENGAIIEF